MLVELVLRSFNTVLHNAVIGLKSRTVIPENGMTLSVFTARC